MPPPIPVVLVPHDPNWSRVANEESQNLQKALGMNLRAVHHIGSTAIPDIRAKPVLDLIPAVQSLTALDRDRSDIEVLGYEWWGEYGLRGRRYCTKDDKQSRQRTVQLHCYEIGSPAITRHLVSGLP
jgi:GrpB-like predicted nucleotidyltransferase (UPF0157 family)